MKGERGELNAPVVPLIYVHLELHSCGREMAHAIFCSWALSYENCADLRLKRLKLLCWKNTQCYEITVIRYCLSLFVIFNFNPFVMCIALFGIIVIFKPLIIWFVVCCHLKGEKVPLVTLARQVLKAHRVSMVSVTIKRFSIECGK